MSISFSGLASGLDTSSWVKSLVALKQAKVTVLQEEREQVALSRDTLSSIKSFFSSFRSVLEKVTDTRFNIATMDIFAQNLATSANLDVLTATATTEAEEGIYQIAVNQIATNTKATSSFNYRTIYEETTLASVDSKLKHLGVNAGTIGVTVNGVEYGVEIEEEDTVLDFIEKLSEIGVNASYNVRTGIFSANISTNDIRDLDGTNIKNALHLEGVNEGYESGSLQTEHVTVTQEIANGNTKLVDLWSENGAVQAGNIIVEANGGTYTIAINNNTSINDFIAALAAKNITATFDENGYFTIKDAEITNDGGTNLIDALGLETVVSSNSQESNALSYETIITVSTVATTDTLLSELGDGITVNNGDTVVVKDSNGEYTTITLNSNSKVGDLLTAMSNAGLRATIDSDGIVEIVGGTITGGSFDAIEALNLNSEAFTAMATGDALTETIEVYELVTLETRIVDDLGVKEGYVEVTDSEGRVQHLKIYSGQTMSDLMTDLVNFGLDVDFDAENGKLAITGGAFETLTDADVNALIANGTIAETQARYKHGSDLLTLLYGASSISLEQTEVAGTYSRTRALYRAITTTIAATNATTLGNLSLTTEGTATFEVFGESRSINVTKADTIDSLMAKLEAVGIASSFDTIHSQLTIENAVITGGTSDLDDILNMTETISGKYISSNNLYTTEHVTATVAVTTESTGDVVHDYTEYAGMDSLISDYITMPADATIQVRDKDGTTIGSVDTNGLTFQEMFEKLSTLGIQGTITDGVVTFTSNNGNYIEGPVLTEMGVETLKTTITTITTTGIQTTTNKMQHEQTLIADMTSKLGTFITMPANATIYVRDEFGATIATVATDADTTFQDLATQLSTHGIQMTIDDGVINFTSNNGSYVQGDVLTALGVEMLTVTTTVTTTFGTAVTGSTITHYNTITADMSSTLGTFVTISAIATKDIYVRDEFGTTIATVATDADTTFQDLATQLSTHGIQMTIDDGVINFTSNNGSYVQGDVLTALGVEMLTVTTTVTTTFGTAVTGSTITHYNTVTADMSSTLGTFVTISAIATKDIYVRDEFGTTIATVATDADTTFQDLATQLSTHGIQMTIDDGVINFTSNNGSYVEGDVLTALGVEMLTETTTVTTTFGTAVTGSAITYKQTHFADMTSTIKDFATETAIEILDKDGNTIHTIDTDDYKTFGDLAELLSQHNIQMSLDEGILTLTSNEGNYAKGDLLTSFNIETKLETIITTTTVGNTVTGGTIKYSVTELATMTSTVENFATETAIEILDKDGNTIHTIKTEDYKTFGDLAELLSQHNIQMSLDEGILTLTSNEGNYAKGDLLTSFNIETKTETITTTTTVGNTVTGDIIKYSVTELATMTSTVADFATENSAINVYDKDGKLTGTVAADDYTTFEQMFAKLSSLGIQGTIADGVVTLTSNNGSYAMGEVLANMGIKYITVTQTTTTTIGENLSSSNALTHDVRVYASMSSLVKDFASKGTITVYDREDNEISTVEVGDNTTFEVLFQKLSSLGIQGTIADGVVTLTSNNGNYATGDPLTAMGITTVETTTKVETTSGITTTGVVKEFTTVIYETTFPNITQTVYTTFVTVATDVTTTMVTTTVSDTYTYEDVTVNKEKITIRDTYTIPAGSIDSDGTITVTHVHVCTEVVMGTKPVTITHWVTQTIVETYTTVLTLAKTIDVEFQTTATVNTGDLTIGLDNTSDTIYYDKTSTVAMTSTAAITYTSNVTTGSSVTSDTLYVVSGGGTNTTGVSYTGDTVYFEGPPVSTTAFLRSTEAVTISEKSRVGNSVTSSAAIVKKGPGLNDIMAHQYVNSSPNHTQTLYLMYSNSAQGPYTSLISFNATDTVQEVIDKLSAAGFTGCTYSVNSNGVGTLDLVDYAGPYVFVMTTPNPSGPQYSCLSGSNSKLTVPGYAATGHVTLSSTYTKLCDILDVEGEVIYAYDSEGVAKKSLTITSTMTLGDIANTMLNYAIITLDGGKVTINPKSGYYIGMSSGLKTALNMSGQDFYTMGSGSSVNIEEAQSFLTQYTLGDIGITGSVTITFTNAASGSTATLSYDEDDALYGLLYGMQVNYGITYDITNGVVTLNGGSSSMSNGSGWYITDMSNELKTALKFDTNSMIRQETANMPMETTTTMEQLGVTSGSNTVTICSVFNGTTHVAIAVDGSTTVGDFCRQLCDNGIEDWDFEENHIVLIAGGAGYISWASSDMTKLGLSSNASSYYTTSAGATTSTTITASDSVYKWLSDNGYTDDDFIFSFYSNGTTKNLNMIDFDEGMTTVTGTFQGFMNWLRTFGFDCSLNNGKLTIKGTDDVYITNIGDAFGDTMGFGNDIDDYYTSESRTFTLGWDEGQSDIYRVTFEDLGLNSPLTFTIEISDGNTITFDKNTILGEVLDELEANGISWSINNGILTLEQRTPGDPIIESATSAFTRALKLMPTSMRQVDTETITASTTLKQVANKLGYADVGATTEFNSLIVVVTNGREEVFDADGNTTYQNIIDWLITNGLHANLSDGKLTINGDARAYVKSCNVGSYGSPEDYGLPATGEGKSYKVENGMATIPISDTKTTIVTIQTQTLTLYKGTSYDTLKLTQTIQIPTWEYKTVTHSVTTTQTVNVDNKKDIVIDVSYTITVDTVTTTEKTGTVSYTLKTEKTELNDVTLTIVGTGTITTTTYKITSTTINNAKMQGDTKIGQLNTAYITGTISGYCGTDAFSITVDKDDTVNDMLTALAGYGISGEVTSAGELKLTGTNYGYITSITDALKVAIGYKSDTVTISTFHTVFDTTITGNANTVGSIMSSVTADVTADTSTKLGEIKNTTSTIGATETMEVKVVDDGTEYKLTFNASHTIDDVLSALAGYGIGGHFIGGKLYLTPTEGSYITSFNGKLANALQLDISDISKLYDDSTTHTITVGCNTTSNTLDREIDENMNADSTMAILGASGNIVVNHEGKDHTITVANHMTLNDLLTALAGYGISGQVSADGILTLSGTNDSYVKSIASGLSSLGISTTATDYYSVSESSVVQGFNTASDTIDRDIDEYMNADSTMAILGASGNIVVNHEGKDHTITVANHMTLNDLLTALAGYGISGQVSADGILTLSGTNDSYVKSIASGLSSLGISTTATDYYSVSESSVVQGFNTASDTLDRETTVAMATEATMKELGATGSISLNYEGKDYTITVADHMTLNDLLTALAGYGISGEVSSDGKLKLTGTDKGYITAVDTTLATKLGISSTGTDYWDSETVYATLGHNTTSDTQNKTVTVSMTADTTMNRLVNAVGKNITVVHQGNTYTVTTTNDMSINDFLTTLAGYGISGEINNGILKLTGTDNGYIVGIDQDLADALGVSRTAEDYWNSKTVYATLGHNTTSDTQNKTITVSMTADTTMNRLVNAVGKNITIVHQGNTYTVTTTNDMSINDFLTTLAGYGISGEINNGILKLTGTDNGYIVGIDQDLADALGVSRTAEDYWNSETVYATLGHNTTSDTQNLTVTVNMTTSSQMSQMGITGGEFKIMHEEGYHTVTVTSDMTLDDLISTLAGYGISGNIHEGVLTLNGTNDSFIEAITGSFATVTGIASGLGNSYNTVITTTTTGINTTSEDQNRTYTVAMTTSSKLEDIYNYTGISDADGTITVNKDGIDYTVDVTKDMSISDIINALSAYGISGTVINGRLELKGSEGAYIKDMSTNVKNALQLNIGEDYTYDSSTVTVQQSITMDTEIGKLTNNANENLNITSGDIYVYDNGTRIKVNVSTSDTIADLAAKLSPYGIDIVLDASGKLHFEGDNDTYLEDCGGSNILTKLNINAGIWETSYDSTSQQLSYEVDGVAAAEGDTAITDLVDENGNSLGITTGTYAVYSRGVRTEEQITDDTTVDDLISTMATYGLIGSQGTDGSISVGADHNTYMATSITSGDDTNLISSLFAEWNFVNIYTSNNLSIPEDKTIAVSETTRLADINEGNYVAGKITVIKDGIQTDIELTADDTLGTLLDELALHGFEGTINDAGQLILKANGDSLLQNYVGTGASNILNILGVSAADWISTKAYQSEDLVSVVTTSTVDTAMTRESKLSELGITTGEYYIWQNGVKHTALISSDETLGSFLDTLASYGINANIVDHGTYSTLEIIGSGDSYVETSNSVTNRSNVIQVLFPNAVDKEYNYTAEMKTEKISTTYANATEDLALSYYDNGTSKAEGDLVVNIDGMDNIIKITADDTFGTLIEKFNALGIEASLNNGTLLIQSGYKELLIDEANSSSKLIANLGLTFHDDLGGYSASSLICEQTVTIEEDVELSVANYADYSTKMSLLNITSGTLSIFRNGERATINVESDETFLQLRSRISTEFADVDIRFQNGYLEFYSTTGQSVEVGATTDTSNLAAICGLTNEKTGSVKSGRELYKVNGDSKITTENIFRRDNVTEGTFIVGDETFTIDENTTLQNIIGQINASEKANATAYWDSVDGKLVIKSRTTGSSFINIEAGTSNFTDVMGYTTSTWDGSGNVEKTKLDVELQDVGDNAVFTINGTTYSSTSNNVGSDITRITGVTINLKNVSEEGETVELKIEKDKESVANAVSDIVDAYNELMENVNKEIAKDGQLHDQSSLKLLRNQVRSLMTNSLMGTSVFRNLDAIGIGYDRASGTNTDVSRIDVLSFDRDKFISAFDSDLDSLKTLLVGNGTVNGVFSQVENVIEQALTANYGYFASADKSYASEISRLDTKIKKAQTAVERYQTRLEAKFASMDLLIANIQNQYSSFLS